MTVGTVTITGLRAYGFHGVLAQERRDGQEFLVDAALSMDLDAAAASDELADTVDYGELSQRLAAVVEGPPVSLLEVLVRRLLDVCLADPRVLRAEVTVHKPQAPVAVDVADVSVTLARSRA